MVVNRYMISCKTCGHNHTLRIKLGTNDYQEHTFACTNCGEDIAVSLEIDFNKYIKLEGFPIQAPIARFSTITNCNIDTKEGTIINLDSNFVIPEELINADLLIPWLTQIENFNITEKLDKYESYYPNLPKLVDFYSIIGGIRNLKEKMEYLVKAWSIYNRGKKNISSQYLKKLAENFFEETYSLYPSIFVFLNMFLGEERSEDIKLICSEFKKAKKRNPIEYSKFRTYYLNEQMNDCLDRHLEILTEYLKNYDDLNQVYIYVKNKINIPNNAQVSSQKFKQLKMFYGDTYEHLTSNLFIAACINNILDGRAFDTFKEMNLQKYVTINKANRANPFKDKQSFYPLINCLDSTLRNASHHGGMRLSNDSNIIKYKSGGTGSLRTISYTEYLYKSNEIMFSSCILLMVQIAIIENLI